MTPRFVPLAIGAAFAIAGGMLTCPTGTYASQIAINFTGQQYAVGSAVNDIARFDAATGTALTPFSAADTLGAWDIAYDAVTGKLYGIMPNSTGSGTQGDRIRAWNADGTYQDIVVNYSSIGLAPHVSAYAQSHPDMVVHNGQIAINFTGQQYAIGSAVNDIARFDAATGTALTPLSAADTFGSWDIAYDAATGKLYGATSNSTGSGTQGDRIRAWNADGTYQDIVVNYSSIGLAPHVSAYAQNHPDMVVHNGQIAINFTSQQYAVGSAVNDIARFDAATGTALTPLSAGDTLGAWDIAYEAATGKLYGIMPNSTGSGTQGDRIRAWNADGTYQDILVNYSSIGLAPHVSAYAQNHPDLVIMSLVPEPDTYLLAGLALVGLVGLRRKSDVGARRHYEQ